MSHAANRKSMAERRARIRSDNLTSDMIQLIRDKEATILAIEYGSIAFQFGSQENQKLRMSITYNVSALGWQSTRDDNLVAELIQLIRDNEPTILSMKSGSIAFHFGNPAIPEVGMSYNTHAL